MKRICLLLYCISNLNCSSMMSTGYSKEGMDAENNQENHGHEILYSDENEESIDNASITQGGRWQERKYLEETNNSGHSEGLRVPADISSEKRESKKNKKRFTKDDFVDLSQEEGSLWASSGQTNYYFTKNKIRSPGDLITLVIEPELLKDVGAEIKKTLSEEEKNNEINLVQNKYKKEFLSAVEKAKAEHAKNDLSKNDSKQKSIETSNVSKTSNNDDLNTVKQNNTENPIQVDPALFTLSASDLEKKAPRATLNDVDIYSKIDLKSGETMMGEILERYMNGNYKIRTVKKIPYLNGEPKIISIVGIVRGVDILEETDQISSGKLYEYRIEKEN